MSKIHLHFGNFNAGELSPLLGNRFAVEKVQAGCRQLRNMIPHVHGPAFRRPGMEYLGPAGGSGTKSNLRSFNFSTTTGAILEFHEDGLRVWMSGVNVELENEVALPYSESELFELQLAQVNDVVYITHPNHAPRKLVRYANNNWKLLAFEPEWPALGDENVRSDEVATPTVTEIETFPTEEWAEFTPPEETLTLTITDPDLSSATKTVTLQRRTTSGNWNTALVKTWTTVAPTPTVHPSVGPRIFRLLYTGPLAPDGLATVTWGAGSAELDLEVAQPETLQPFTVAAGEWQVTVVSNTTKPSGTACNVQKLSGINWVTLKRIVPIAGESARWRGPTLTASTSVRLNWEGVAMDGDMIAEQVVFPAADDITIAVSDTTGDGKTMTASKAIFQAGHVGSFWQIVHRRDSSFQEITRSVGAFAATQTTGMRVQGSWDVFTYGTWDATLYLEKYVNGAWEILRTWKSNEDRNVIANGTEEQEVELRLRITAGTGTAATGADVPRFVLEASDARVSGIVEVTAVGTLDANGKATTATVNILTTLHATTATSLWTEGAWSDVKGFPRAVAIHGQRLWFAGTATEPLRLWGSVVSDFENFRRSTYDDASVSFTPAAQQSNRTQWLCSFGKEMVIGNSGEEWTISGATDDGPITPTSVQMVRRSGYGSAFLPGILLGEVVVFTQRGARKMRQVAPRADGIVWSAADLTALAPHVTKAGIMQFAVMQHPFTILWGVTGDGKLIAMTFETEQNVYAWHVHETDGTVESVAVVQGADADEVWLSVLRGSVRSIERLDPEVFAGFMDAGWEDRTRLIYLDSAIRIELDEPSVTLTGLAHLEAKQVCVLGDGADMGTFTVIAGSITLPSEVSLAVVGLNNAARVQPMRPDIPLRDGTATARNWKTNRIALHVHESLGGEILDAEGMKSAALNYRRVSDAMDSPPPLFTGIIETGLDASARDGIDVTIQVSGPHPFNLAAIIWKGDLSGE